MGGDDLDLHLANIASPIRPSDHFERDCPGVTPRNMCSRGLSSQLLGLPADALDAQSGSQTVLLARLGPLPWLLHLRSPLLYFDRLQPGWLLPIQISLKTCLDKISACRCNAFALPQGHLLESIGLEHGGVSKVANDGSLHQTLLLGSKYERCRSVEK